MATKYYLLADSATGAVPNAKQSADTITHDVAASYATYAVPAKLSITAGAADTENSASVGGYTAAHNTHYGSWISDPLAAQTISGTITIALAMAQGNNKSANFARVKVYKWLANDTFGSDLLALTTCGTEILAAFPSAPATFFAAVSITSTSFAAGDRIVIEIESADTATSTTSYLHGIRFGGADAGAYGSYVEFSATITPPTTTYQQTLAVTETTNPLIGAAKKIIANLTVAEGTAISLTCRSTFSRILSAITTPSTAITNLFTWKRLLTVTETATSTLSKISSYYKTLAITGTVTAKINRMMNKILAVTESVSTLLTAVKAGVTRTQTLAVTGVTSCSLTCKNTFIRTLSVIGTAGTTIARTLSFYRNLAVTGTVTTLLNKQRNILLTATTIASSAITLKKEFYRTLSTVETAGISILKKNYKTISALISANLILNAIEVIEGAITYYITCPVQSAGQITFQKTRTVIRTLSALVTTIPARTSVSQFYRTLSIQTVNLTSTIKKGFKTMLVQAAGATTTFKKISKTILSVSTGIPTISKSALHFLILSTTTLAKITISAGGRRIYQTLTVTTTAIPSLTKTMFITLSATITGTLRLFAGRIWNIIVTKHGTTSLIVERQETMTSSIGGSSDFHKEKRHKEDM